MGALVALPLEPVAWAAPRRQGERDPRSPRRFHVLGGPGGRLNCMAAGDPRLHEPSMRRWVVLLTVNRPMTPALARAAKGKALRCFSVA